MSGARGSLRPPADVTDRGPAEDPESVARRILLARLTDQPRTRAELAGFLAAKDVPDEVATRLLDRFTEVGLIDDAAFARAWITSRLAGRGLARRALASELRRKGVSDEVAREALDEIDAALYRDLRQGFSLAKKAGAVVTGFAKVEAEIGGGGIAALVHASEAAEDSRRKLQAALRRRFGDDAGRIPVIDDVAGDDLDLALGRSHVIHAALVAGAGSDGFLNRWHRYRSYSGLDADQAGLDIEAGEPTILKPAGT